MKKQRVTSQETKTRLSRLISDLPVQLWRQTLPYLDLDAPVWLFRASKVLHQRKTGIAQPTELILNLFNPATRKRLLNAAFFEAQVIRPSQESLRALDVRLAQLDAESQLVVSHQIVALVAAARGLKRLQLDFPAIRDLDNEDDLPATTRLWSALVSETLDLVSRSSLEHLTVINSEHISSNFMARFDAHLFEPLWSAATKFQNLRVLRIDNPRTPEKFALSPPQVSLRQKDLIDKLLPIVATTIEDLFLPLTTLDEDFFVHLARTKLDQLQRLGFKVWKTLAQTGDLPRHPSDIDSMQERVRISYDANQVALRLFDGVSKFLSTSVPRLAVLSMDIMDFKEGWSRVVNLSSANRQQPLMEAGNQSNELVLQRMFFHSEGHTKDLGNYYLRLIQGLGMAKRCAKVHILEKNTVSMIQTTETADPSFPAALQHVLGKSNLVEFTWQGDVQHRRNIHEWATNDDLHSFLALFPNLVKVGEMKWDDTSGPWPHWRIEPSRLDSKLVHAQFLRSPGALFGVCDFWNKRIRELTIESLGMPEESVFIMAPMTNLVELTIRFPHEGKFHRTLLLQMKPLSQVRTFHFAGYVDRDFFVDCARVFPLLERLHVQTATADLNPVKSGNILRSLHDLRELSIVYTGDVQQVAMPLVFLPQDLFDLLQANPALETLVLDWPNLVFQLLPSEDAETLRSFSELKTPLALRSMQVRWDKDQVRPMLVDQIEAWLRLVPKLELMDLTMGRKNAPSDPIMKRIPTLPGYGPVSISMLINVLSKRVPWAGKIVRLPTGLPLLIKLGLVQEVVQAMPWEQGGEQKLILSRNEILRDQFGLEFVLMERMNRALARIFKGAKIPSFEETHLYYPHADTLWPSSNDRIQIVGLPATNITNVNSIWLITDSRRAELMSLPIGWEAKEWSAVCQELQGYFDHEIEFIDSSGWTHPLVTRIWSKNWIRGYSIVYGYLMATLRVLLRPDFPLSVLFHWFGSGPATERKQEVVDVVLDEPEARLERFLAYVLNPSSKVLQIYKPVESALVPPLETDAGVLQTLFEQQQGSSMTRAIHEDAQALVLALTTGQAWKSLTGDLEFLPPSKLLVQSFHVPSGQVTRVYTGLAEFLALMNLASKISIVVV